MAVKVMGTEKESLLKAVEGAAIVKAVKQMAKETKTITPGEYAVDITVRVKGSVKKGADHSTTVTPALLTLDNLLLALSMQNAPTRKSVLAEMIKAHNVRMKMNIVKTPGAKAKAYAKALALEDRVNKIKKEAEIDLAKAKISVASMASGATTVKLDSVEVIG